MNWDGQLRSASNAGGEIRCRYDPDGNRIRREVQATGQPTQARKYIVDAEGDVPMVLLEIDPAVTNPNQAIVRTFLYADTQLVAFHDGFYGDPLYFALSDQHGSVRQVMDESGAVVNGYAYDPWGSPLAAVAFEAVAEPIRYAGYWWDADIQRYYCWARYYDPLLERFLSRDPESGSFEEPMELHRYLYCLNNPVNRDDPSGRESLSEQEAAMGANATVDSGAMGGLNYQGLKQLAQGFKNFWNFRNKMLDYAIQSKDGVWTWTRGVGQEIHHIVGQGWRNAAKFGNDLIDSFQNMVSLPEGIHAQVTRFFNSGSKLHTFMGNTGGSLQKWIASSLTFEEQARWGLAVLDYLIAYGTLVGFNPAMYSLPVP